MSISSSRRDPVEELAEEFADRYRRGEHPSLTEYTERYPELAEQIRDLFPALMVMERLGSVAGPPTGPFNPGVGAPSAPSRQLGEYRILREVGRGGMGVVYEAVQEPFDRHVALKILPFHHLMNPTHLERFRRESRAAAQLHHTNIVPVFGVGEAEGIHYYAMQFIQGQGLDAVLEEVRRLRGDKSAEKERVPLRTGGQSRLPRPRPDLSISIAQGLLTGWSQEVPVDAPSPQGGAWSAEPEALLAASPSALHAPHSATRSELAGQTEAQYCRSVAHVGVQVAEGLAYAHRQRILHRDIKPSNLLLDTRGTVWITDFGLAKAEGSDDLTTPGDIVGTVRFMAPERFQGKADPRSDVYSAGITLYEMLTLRPAFADSNRARLMERVSHEDPRPPRKEDPHIPRDLETIVMKAIAKEPAARYQNAEALAEDLRRFLENRPIEARRSSTTERVRRWCGRNPAVASLLGAVFLLLTGLTAGSVGFALWLNQQRLALASAERERTVKLCDSLQGQANASRFSRQVGQRFATLENVRQAAELVRERHMPAERLDELRKLAISALALPDLRTLRTWEGFPPGSQSWNADDQLRLYARSNLGGVISLRRIDTDEETVHFNAGAQCGWLQFAPGGRFFLGDGDKCIRVWDVSKAEPQVVWQGQQRGFAFHPDGRHLLVCTEDGSVGIYDLEVPQQQPLCLMVNQPGGHFAFDATGNRLAMISEHSARILDAKTGKVVATIPESQPMQSSAWHPSGNYLALVCSWHDIHVWDLKRMTRMADLKGCRNAGIRVQFTPDGDRLLSNGWEAILRLWDWRTGRQVLQHRGGYNLHMGLDGRLLIDERSGLSLVAVASGGEYRSFVRQSDLGTDIAHWTPAMHPEGRLFAVAMSDRVRLFDLETGDELAAVPQSNYHIAFQADGALLTNGNRGLLRWPIYKADPGRWQLGPPKLLDWRSYIDMASDRYGEVIGQATGNGAFLVRPGKASVYLQPHTDARHIAISPNGAYVLTGNHEGDEGIKIWDPKTRRMIIRFPMGRLSFGQFSPDGQWLAMKGVRGCKVVKVGTWETVFEDNWDGGYAFSPDGSLLAVASARGVIRLLEPATGRELTQVEDPNQAMPASLLFAPDGTRLLTCSDEERTIHAWDLRAIRAQLAELGLDWDAAPYPEASPTAPSPLQVKVDLGSAFVDDRTTVGLNSFRLVLDPFDFEAYFQRGRAYGQLKERAKALADYSMALTLMPPAHPSRGEALFRRSNNFRSLNDLPKAEADLRQIAELNLEIPLEMREIAAQQCNNLAWRYVTGLEKERDAQKALPLAQKAVKLAPNQGLNTLGVAYYRLGQYAEAIKTLERSLRESEGEAAAFDLFFLALCHGRQGEAAKAKDCYDRAMRWVREQQGKMQPGWKEELDAFRAETEALLQPQNEKPTK